VVWAAVAAVPLPLAVWAAGVPWLARLLPGAPPWHLHVAHAAAMVAALVAAGAGAGYLLARMGRAPRGGPAAATGGRYLASGVVAGAVLAAIYGVQARADGDWHQWSVRLPVGAVARQTIALPPDWRPPPGGRAELRLYVAGSRDPLYDPVVRVDGREVARLGPAFADAGPLRFWAQIMVAARNQGKTRAEVPQWVVVAVDPSGVAQDRLNVEVAVEPASPPGPPGPPGQAAPAGSTAWARLWGDYALRPGARVYDGPALYSRIPGADEAFLKYIATGEYGIWRSTPLRSRAVEAAWRRGAGWDSADLSDLPGRQTGEYRIRLLVYGPGGDLLGVY
jgi:hypothetical protein